MEKFKLYPRQVKLYALIKGHYRSNYEAAAALGVADYSLSCFLNGRKQIPEDVLERIEVLFKTKRKYFLIT